MSIYSNTGNCIGDTFASEEKYNKTSSRKVLSPEEQESAEYLQTFWDFKGYLAKSPLFYGYYSNDEYILDNVHYRLPLAYFLVNLCVLGYSFFAILRKMASNARNSKLSSGKTEEYNFSWLVFANWDYTIGNPETAGNTMMANVTKLRVSSVLFHG
ncbi:unnamed protein product [Soboliphyme baturini]|uniref:Anoctamin n=1 Tax=Soboliphyme baturini TaxID=241478 RepID=A0A183IPA9_9BILA|nr:unnamed protein product [Soboliphyme baturini]